MGTSLPLGYSLTPWALPYPLSTPLPLGSSLTPWVLPYPMGTPLPLGYSLTPWVFSYPLGTPYCFVCTYACRGALQIAVKTSCSCTYNIIEPVAIISMCVGNPVSGTTFP